jgi:GntR family transcriptional regulator, arabinose operon transcriptional repressor
MSKFLYKQIKDYLLQLVADNKRVPHYKLPSENQIAVKFNTSRITAKRALTELQDEGYIYRIQGKGSYINQEKEDVKSKNTADFVCMLLPNIGSDFISTLVAGARKILKQNGYHLLLMSEKEDELLQSNLVSGLVDMGVKGIIVFPNNSARYNKDLLLLAFNKFPVVFVDRTLHNIDVSSVTSDHLNMSKKAVQHLIDRGCKNIGLITMPADYGNSTSRRISGYERAHMDNNMLIKASNILYVTKDMPDLKDRIRDFLQSNPDLDGLLSYGDIIGIDVYTAIQSLNIQVPKDLKVVFFDNEYMNYQGILPFTSTSVAQRSSEIGETAANLLIKYIKNHSVGNDKILIETDIIERESTKNA